MSFEQLSRHLAVHPSQRSENDVIRRNKQFVAQFSHEENAGRTLAVFDFVQRGAINLQLARERGPVRLDQLSGPPNARSHVFLHLRISPG
jgi:hypothetical protein